MTTITSDGRRSAWTFWKHQSITRHTNDPYMDRLVMLRCPWFAVYFHRFLSADDECMHDHPWPFISIILRGGYWEYTASGKRWYGPGRILFRAAEWVHRVEIVPGRTTWSLVIAGKRKRDWGFHTAFGWIDWRKYVYAEHCA